MKDLLNTIEDSADEDLYCNAVEFVMSTGRASPVLINKKITFRDFYTYT